MLKYLSRSLIHAYQKHISPRKGYGCAHRVYGGSKTGCSGHALRLLNKYSFILAMRLLRRRFDRCAWYAHEHNKQVQKQIIAEEKVLREKYAFARSQAGFCDAGCDVGGCDAPSCDLPSCDFPKVSCGLFDGCGGAGHTAVEGGEGCHWLRWLDFFNFCDCGNCNTNSSSANTSSVNNTSKKSHTEEDEDQTMNKAAAREEKRRTLRRKYLDNKQKDAEDNTDGMDISD